MVKNPNVIEAEEAALEDVAAFQVLLVHPAGEIHHQLVEDTLQEVEVAHAGQRRIHAEHPPRRPGMHRRVDVAERPFIGRQRAIRVHEPFMRQQQQLVLGEGRVDQRECHRLERQVPGGIPGVLPSVGHRDDVAVVQVLPVVVAMVPPLGWRRGLQRIAF